MAEHSVTYKAAPTVEQILAGLVKAVNEAYPDDKTRPSVLTAYIESKAQWYVSVIKYDNAQNRTIITSVYNTSLHWALLTLAGYFLEITVIAPPLARQALADLLK
jgi:hypothetical protein